MPDLGDVLTHVLRTLESLSPTSCDVAVYVGLARLSTGSSKRGKVALCMEPSWEGAALWYAAHGRGLRSDLQDTLNNAFCPDFYLHDIGVAGRPATHAVAWPAEAVRDPAGWLRREAEVQLVLPRRLDPEAQRWLAATFAGVKVHYGGCAPAAPFVPTLCPVAA